VTPAAAAQASSGGESPPSPSNGVIGTAPRRSGFSPISPRPTGQPTAASRRD